ncbi:hypothetical protein J6590_068211 [Homalodisca vitripennis]|nr:hypothetical protein J6590_068211 [Homalodisca vitripennis]
MFLWIHDNELIGDSGQIASPLYPKPYTQARDYKWTITVPFNKVIRISFSEFYMENYIEDEECFIYLEIFDGLDVDGSSPSLLKACGTALPEPVVTSANVAAIKFHNDPYLHGSYFLLRWEAVSRQSIATMTVDNSLGCGKEIHISSVGINNTAVVSSPGYPQNYKRNLQCTWIVDTDPGYHLVINFTTMDLEQFDECNSDYVAVYTESEEESTGWKALTSKLCLPNTTTLFIEAYQRAKLYFETDRTVQKTGFSATVNVDYIQLPYFMGCTAAHLWTCWTYRSRLQQMAVEMHLREKVTPYCRVTPSRTRVPNWPIISHAQRVDYERMHGDL